MPRETGFAPPEVTQPEKVEANKLEIEPICQFPETPDRWLAKGRNVYIAKGNQIYKNGQTAVLPEGMTVRDWCPTPEGIEIYDGSRFLRVCPDGQIETLHTKTDQFKDYETTAQGFTIREGNIYSMHGREMLDITDTNRSKSLPDGSGFVVQSRNKLKVVTPGNTRVVREENWSNTDYSWKAHPAGAAIEHRTGDGIEVYINNDREPIFKGSCDWWEPYRNGIITRHDFNTLKINGQEPPIYEGVIDECQVTEAGIMICRGSEWILLKDSQTDNTSPHETK
jgi:hypothetical protein